MDKHLLFYPSKNGVGMQIFRLLFVGSFLGLSVQGIAQDWGQRAEPYTFETQSGAAVEAERGTFRVPENRSRATPGKSITLKYIPFPATTESPSPPLFTWQGALVDRELRPHEDRDSKCFNRCDHSAMSLHLTNVGLA